MKYLSLIFLILSSSALAGKVHVSCWSGSHLIYNKMVIEIIPGDGYIVTRDEKNVSVISANCVIDYPNEKWK